MCFGFGTKPITSDEYETSPNLFVVRAWNGLVYGAGKARTEVPKLHESNRIRFDWNAAAGEVSLTLNGTKVGVVFTGVKYSEIFPVVCSYGVEGVASLEAIEDTLTGSAAAAPSAAAAFDAVRGGVVRVIQ